METCTTSKIIHITNIRIMIHEPNMAQRTQQLKKQNKKALEKGNGIFGFYLKQQS